MRPVGHALEHPYGPFLLDLALTGCPAETGPPWTPAMLDAAIAYGAHPSARIPEAAAACQAETLDKVAAGYATLVNWDSLKANPPPQLKISPIVAIPHKSRAYRMILDLSKGITLNKIAHPSVNQTTDKTIAPSHSMHELGNVLPRLIYAAATAPDTLGPVLFAKFDIKDGYWRMRVRDGDEWNFAFVLPKKSTIRPHPTGNTFFPPNGVVGKPGIFLRRHGNCSQRRRGTLPTRHWLHSPTPTRKPHH